MSATSFGGSLNMVSSNGLALQKSMNQFMMRGAIDAILPFVKYIPLIPPCQSPSLVKLTQQLIATRKEELIQKGQAKKDILQMLLNSQDADPVTFSDLRVLDEMNTFM
jgi:cytochrome P450